MGHRKRLLFFAMAAALAARGALTDDVCSGHGIMVDGKCVCSSPLPVEGSPGWVGDHCSTPVHRVFLDGEDVQDTCEQGQGHPCNVVTPAEPVCFSTGIADLANATFHLGLLLSSNNVDAVVVLHGLLTNFTVAAGPAATAAAPVVPKAYPNSDTVFSFSVRTDSGSPSAQLKLSRRQLGYGAYTGLYLCVTSNATAVIGLRAAEHACPFDLLPNGTLRLCSGRGTSDTCPHGICTCPPPYTPPANWVVTPGLGFEDCSTALLPLQPSVPLTVPALAPGGWVFFSLEAPPASGHELRAWAAASEATTGSLALYLRHQQLPGDAPEEHDLAADPASWAADQSVHLALRRRHPLFQPGTWYLGAHNRGLGPVSFTVGSALYDCPNNCSGRGTCTAATATCTCGEGVSPLSLDCSVSLRELALGQTLTAPPRDLSYDELVLHGIRERLAAAGGPSRLHLSASFTTTDPDPPGLPVWVGGRPLLFAAPAVEAALNQTLAAAGSSSSGDGRPLFPPGGGVESLVMGERGATYSLEIGPWALGDDGSLRLLVWSPLSSPLRQVGYSLGVELRAQCPAGCSGHGSCDAATGVCTCQAPFLGSDCSVDPSVLACAPGTRKPVRREGLRGVCLAPCRDDGRSFDDANCDELACDGPGEGHGPLRRKGGEVECVEDACVAGNYSVTDASGDFLCSRRCACPPDGGPCAMEPVCLPGTKQCLRDLRLAPDGESCVAAPCEEGALRRVYDMEGGSAFAVCVCAAAGDPASCAFTAPSPAAGNADGVVSCLPGFERQGSTSSARLSDGVTLVMGGRCGRARRRGVSGGMVFFYCLLSILLAAGLVVGGKYGVLWYEQYRYGRSVFSQGYVSWPLFGGRGVAGGGTDDW